MGATLWDQVRESAGTICIGIVVAIIVVLFLVRMQDWTTTVLESIITIVFGLGALKAFKYLDAENIFFFPIGIFLGIILCALVLISPYAEPLIRWSTVPTPTSTPIITTLPTISQTITAVPTTGATPVPTMTNVSALPSFNSSQLFSISWISILVIILAITFLIAYLLEKQKEKQKEK